MSLCHDELVITILVLVDILLVGIDQLQNAKENMQLLAFLECDSQSESTNLALAMIVIFIFTIIFSIKMRRGTIISKWQDWRFGATIDAGGKSAWT